MNGSFPYRVGCLLAITTALLSTGCAGDLPWSRSKSRSASSSLSPPLAAEVVPDEPAKRDAGSLALAWGRSAETQQQYDRAEELYRRAMQFPRHKAAGAHRLANLFVRRGRVEEAEPFYRQALAEQPKNVDLLADLGYTMYLQRRWAEAQGFLDQAVQLDGAHARSHNNLGLVLAHQGQTTAALREFRRAGLGGAEAHVNLALVHLAQGQVAEADKSIKQAQRVDAQHPAVQRLMAALPRTGTSPIADAPTSPAPASTAEAEIQAEVQPARPKVAHTPADVKPLAEQTPNADDAVRPVSVNLSTESSSVEPTVSAPEPREIRPTARVRIVRARAVSR